MSRVRGTARAKAAEEVMNEQKVRSRDKGAVVTTFQSCDCQEADSQVWRMALKGSDQIGKGSKNHSGNAG